MMRPRSSPLLPSEWEWVLGEGYTGEGGADGQCTPSQGGCSGTDFSFNFNGRQIPFSDWVSGDVNVFGWKPEADVTGVFSKVFELAAAVQRVNAWLQWRRT